MSRLPAPISLLLCLALAGVGFVGGTLVATSLRGAFMRSGREVMAMAVAGGIPGSAAGLQLGAMAIRRRRIRWGLLAVATLLAMWAIPRLAELRAATSWLDQAQAEYSVLALLLGPGTALLTLRSIGGDA